MKKLVLTVWVIAILCGMAVQAFASVSTTVQSAVAADGNGTAVTVYDVGTLGINVIITGKASVNFEGSINGGTTYGAISCIRSGSTSGFVTTTNSSGLFYCYAPGLTNARAPVQGLQTGTVTVVINTMQMTLNTLLSCEDQTNSLCMTSGGAVRGTATNLMSAVSTNTTGTATALPTGPKTIHGILTCNAGGSTNCGITVTIYGSSISSQATGTFEQLCQVIIPTGTAVQSMACSGISTSWLYMWATTTGVAGTSPSLNVSAMY